jgi:putative membrane protein
MATVIISDADRARIRQAVVAAEAKTSGEIFTVVAHESDDYRFIPVLWATAASLLVPLPLVYLSNLPASVIFLIQLGVFAGLAIVLSLPSLRLLTVPPALKREVARGLAARQFLAHGLHTTEARTGVLIFVSLAERYAEIIADAGIAAKVEDKIWEQAMAQLLAEIKAGRLAKGLIVAIEGAGILLARHFPPRPMDRNELPNDLVLL